MVRFTFICMGLSIVLLFGVLLGMQLANSGIHELRGYNDPHFQGALHFNNIEGSVEATVLGQRVTEHDINAKKEELKSFKALNVISKLGQTVAQFFMILFNKIISIVNMVLQQII